MQARNFGHGSRVSALVVLALCVGGNHGAQLYDGGGGVNESSRHSHVDLEHAVEQRTFILGKLVLVPVLAAVGIKFLALLPIVLAKIALLSVMNFLSTNLNILVSTLFGVKRFLGKFGLWAQEDATRHPALQTFAEYAQQPILSPSFQYQYLLEKESSSPSEATMSPVLLKTYDSLRPTLTAVDVAYGKPTVDRRIRVYDKRHTTPKSQERNVNGGKGKYKCYWSDEEDDNAALYNQLSTTGASKDELSGSRRRFGVTEFAKVNPYNYVRHISSYRVPPYKILSTIVKNHGPSRRPFHNRRSFVTGGRNEEDSIYRQAETERNAYSSPESSYGEQPSVQDNDNGTPFTDYDVDNEVKVTENHHTEALAASSSGVRSEGDEEEEHEPIVYVLNETSGEMNDTATVKFKDDEVVAGV